MVMLVRRRVGRGLALVASPATEAAGGSEPPGALDDGRHERDTWDEFAKGKKAILKT